MEGLNAMAKPNRKRLERYKTWGYLDACRSHYGNLTERQQTEIIKKNTDRDIDGKITELGMAWRDGWKQAHADITLKQENK